MCYKPKFDKMYEYQSYSYIERYKPEHFKKICGNWIYKEVFGSKIYKLKKKEGALDNDLWGM